MNEIKQQNLIELFMQINQQVNLSAIRDYEWIKTKHIKDSLQIENLIELKNKRNILDLGTGWWFPLLPLSIEYPKCNFVWIDWRKKKINAINTIIKELKIENAKWIRQRAENHKKSYDLITARAVWHVSKIVPLCCSLIKRNWYILLYKQNNKEEYEDLLKICNKKSLEIIKSYNYKLFENDIQRIIYLLK